MVRNAVQVLDAIAAALVRPWRDRRRALVLLVGMAGGFSISLMSFSVQAHMAQLGVSGVIVYAAILIPVAGAAGFALSYHSMAACYGRLIFVVAQLAGLGLILCWPGVAWVSALSVLLLHMPFWSSYHLRFAVNRSRENHGPETALSLLLFLFSSAAGTVSGGWLLQHDLYAVDMGVSACFLLGTTQFMFKRLAARPFARDGWRLLLRRRVSMRISVLNGAASAPSDFAMAAWMLAGGASPLVGGMMLAARPVLGLLITPLVGRLAHRGGRQAVMIGGAVLVLAWGEIGVAGLVTSSPFALLPGFALLAVGGNLVNPAELGRWYKSRSSAGIIARENALTVGRIPALALALPLACLVPHAFPFAAAVMAMGLVAGGFVRVGKRGRGVAVSLADK